MRCGTTRRRPSTTRRILRPGCSLKYINCFLKLKIEASGWPESVKTEEEKDAFIKECWDREGVLLEKDKIKKDPGLRSLAKLCLNSFWGKVRKKKESFLEEYYCFL